MTIGERIKKVRGDRTQADFSRLTTIPKNTLGRYERGEIVPGGEAIALLCKNLDIDSNWLLFGEGPMRREEPAPATAPATAQAASPPAEDDFKMSDMLTKTAEVLESDTIYRTALASNINAFHQAVRSERTLAQLEERMAALETRMEELANENSQLKMRVEQQAKNLDGYNVSENNAQTYDQVAEDPDSYNGEKKAG